MSNSGSPLALFGHHRSALSKLPFVQRIIRRRFLRRHAAAVVLSEDMAVCRILGRFKLYTDPQDWSISPHIMLDGIWEPRVTETIIDLIEPGMTAIDVGANVGYFTILLAALAGPAGHVLSVEPNPAMVRRIEASLMANGFNERVSIHSCPVGAVEGTTVTLAIPPNHPGGAQITGAELDGWQKIQAVTRRLDMLPEAMNADFVKIDAEGMEPAIWQGMSAMVSGRQLKTVVLEFTPDGTSTMSDMIDEIIAAGFSLEWISEQGIKSISRNELFDETHQLRMLLLRR